MLVEISPLINETPTGPLIGAGTIPCGYDEKEIDIQVSMVPVHPANSKDLERFKGKKVTVSIPELTLQRLQDYCEADRDIMRYTEEYAAVCRQLSYSIVEEIEKRELEVDYALTIDHSGQLLTMFVAKIADIETYEIRRIKKHKADGTIDLTILLPQNLYPFDGKKLILLDEFINTGFTLREVIKTLVKGGATIQLIGAFKKLEGAGKLLEKELPGIPIVTLE
ncbi:MAG: phosphoribosyltransferase [Firmicutes bacterium]|nr:phosphoribosyltransferase [Bacillota bacterium]